MRRLSSRDHGFVDYGVAVLELALAFGLPTKKWGRRLLLTSGINAAALGALTDYELGLLKVIPMRLHLALDGVFAAGFLAAPLLLDDERDSVRVTLAALGTSGAIAAAMTDPDR